MNKNNILFLILFLPSINYSMENDGTEEVRAQLQLATIDSSPKNKKQNAILPFPQVYFSPGIKEVLITFIRNEQKELKGAWYRFTLFNAAKTISEKIKNERVKTTFVIDKSNFSDDFCSPLALIAKAGGSIYKQDKDRNLTNPGRFETMHHKFMIFSKNVNNKKLLWTGSFNATGQADKKNSENVCIIDDPASILKFETEFKTLLEYSSLISPKDYSHIKDTGTKYAFARSMNDIP